ncbi:rhodanese-like domain-containing protein [Rhodobium gokarnense]|uniref:3-mercaptopyruvate sulfurtransferase SseA n=1 Tax=Rhodobium gokarnense TaxID=364296 RepID=A0ABT3H8C6_9HYPH|nr:rhodanese-like domain-containing protein [Rhodobium gokarnense]MCW2306652.1 3-mercaptopyruvate sulfurtransferase SseA [Rhodobium gokarnense]
MLKTPALLIGLAAVLLAGAGTDARADFRFLDDAAAIPAGVVVVDSRDADTCAGGAPARAETEPRCVPIAAVIGPNGRLASFRDVAWFLGTVGLDGSETVLVIGARERDRDAVAGLLHLAGQKGVLVWQRPINALGEDFATVSGRISEPARRAVFREPTRDDRIVLRDDLQRMLAGGGVLLLDGRPAEDFWGERTTGARAGHLPGAQSLPARALRGATPVVAPDGVDPVLYGRGAVDGLAYYTAVAAGRGRAARVYLEGFANWAASGLPLDAESHPDLTAPGPERVRAKPRPAPRPDGKLLALSASVGALLGAAVAVGTLAVIRRRKA